MRAMPPNKIARLLLMVLFLLSMRAKPVWLDHSRALRAAKAKERAANAKLSELRVPFLGDVRIVFLPRMALRHPCELLAREKPPAVDDDPSSLRAGG